MFNRGEGPVGVVSNQGQCHWGPSPATNFAFDLANPDLFLKQNLHSLYLLSGKQAAFRVGLQNMASRRSEDIQGNFRRLSTESQHYHLRANDFDQSMVWFQNMEDPNEAFRGPTVNSNHTATNDFSVAPGNSNNSNLVSLPSSSNNNHHGNARARRQANVNPSTGPGGLKLEPNAANTEDMWSLPSNSSNLNQAFSQPINPRGSQQRWPPVAVPSNDYLQAYGFPDGLAHGLPVFPNSQGFSPSFDLGPALGGGGGGGGGGMPNIDSSSSSSCRVNGSSPNTVFGSFSSSIGPPDMMDMDMREECFHSPSVFPSEVPSCHNPGAIPPAFLSRCSPAHDFPVSSSRAAIAAAVFPAEADTVSPKMLHLNGAPSLPSSSSSESLPNPFRMDSDPEVQALPSSSSVAAVAQQDILPSSAWQARRETANARLNTAGRKQLPDKAPHSRAGGSGGGVGGSKRRHGGDAAGEKSSSSKKPKAKGKVPSQSSHVQPKTQPSSSHSHRGQHAGGSGHSGKGGSSTRRKASPSSSSSKANNTGATGAGATEASTATTNSPPRSERDEYLVRSKLAGMTYKEIRKQGAFTEAESTLRGRFRTLTKPKEARVRKPEFQEIDDKLLKRGVVKLTKDVDEITRDNVPWKLVSEYMADHGGSYLFGYTTIRKRWEYLMATSEEQVKQDRLDNKLQQ